jgi:uncharacterized protein YraI
VTIRRFFHRVLILSLVGAFLSLNAGVVLAQGPVAADRPSVIEGPHGSVSAWKLNVRLGPGTGYPIVTTVSYRELLGLTGRTYDSSWLRIRRDEGQQGWVSAYYMVVSAAHLSAVPIVDGTQPSPEPPSSEITGYVTAYRLNVRSGPGADYSPISMLREGQMLTLVGRNTSTTWLQVNLPGGSQGWASAHYIGSPYMLEALPITGGAVPNPQPGATATVTTDKLNVRSGPSTAYGIMAWVYMGQQVQMVGRNNARTWLKIAVGHGLEGWVSAAYITTNYPIADLPVVE